tara:strand:- start:16382 stop:16828 length:447 start_codon:yes stop_codon:yes gene_type:complete
MSLSSFTSIKIFRFFNVRFERHFLWGEFICPSTLQLSIFIKLLLEPVRNSNQYSRIELGIHEALVNAVQHGNLSDPTKSIRVRRILTPNWIVWQIQDEGNGIAIQSRVSALPLDVEVENGRGLFLIHSCFDDVRWSKKGNRLQVGIKR